jgi:hypothetical protein
VPEREQIVSALERIADGPDEWDGDDEQAQKRGDCEEPSVRPHQHGAAGHENAVAGVPRCRDG